MITSDGKKQKLDMVIRILYPRRCPICQEIIVGNGYVCSACKKELPYIKEPRCKKCGKSLDEDVQEYCFDCAKGKHVFDKGVAVWRYTKAMKQSIHRFKYDNKREYADFFVEEVIKHYGEWIGSMQVDAVIPVPLHRSKQRMRGFNQAELIAKGIGKALDLPVETKYVERYRKTKVQNVLNDTERKNNVKKAFKITCNDVKLKRILLVDDIYTTGSTIDAIAEVLKTAGAEQVYFCCLCAGRGY